MKTSNEIITHLVKNFSIHERLLIIEEILRSILEERVTPSEQLPELGKTDEPEILSLAGILDEEEADEMNSAIEESRKIDRHEW